MTKCKRCGKEVEEIELFTGGICVDCYEKEFDKMSEEEKKPVFGANLLK